MKIHCFTLFQDYKVQWLIQFNSCYVNKSKEKEGRKEGKIHSLSLSLSSSRLTCNFLVRRECKGTCTSCTHRLTQYLEKNYFVHGFFSLSLSLSLSISPFPSPTDIHKREKSNQAKPDGCESLDVVLSNFELFFLFFLISLSLSLRFLCSKWMFTHFKITTSNGLKKEGKIFLKSP